MSVANFLEVVEIKTKIASVFPFLVGLLFTVTYYQEFHLVNTLLFFAAMLIFDMTTTAINNYQDYQKAKSEEYKHGQNVIGRENISPTLVRNLILFMLVVAAGLGFYLAFRTGWLLLLLGGVCCFIGVFYTYGPIPLSRMPLGEVFSGVTMGLGIFAMIVYVNTMDAKLFYLNLDIKSGTFALVGNFWLVAAMVLASLPLIFTIANIMLANNLRDLDTDIKNHRYTLVYYIGRDAGTKLFSVLMYGSFLAVLLGFLLGLFQWPILVVFLTLPGIRKNLLAHKAELPAPHSFVYSLKNMVTFNGSYVLGLLLTLLWQKVF